MRPCVKNKNQKKARCDVTAHIFNPSIQKTEASETNLTYIASSRPVKDFSPKRKKRQVSRFACGPETVERKELCVCHGGALGEQKFEM